MLTTTIVDLDSRPAASLLDRDRRRRHRPLSRDAASLPLDGHHADAAGRACRVCSGPTSCMCSAFGIRSRRESPPGAGSRASRTSSSRSGCSSRGCARWCSSARSTRRSIAVSARGAAAVVVASEREARRGDRSGRRAPKRCACAATAFPSPSRRARTTTCARASAFPAGAADPLRRQDRRRERHRAPARRGARAPRRPSRDRRAGRPSRHVGARPASATDAATSGRVHVLPVTEEPPHDLYPQADVFVLASAGESFGIVAAEAAAAGTPVIVSDRCGIAEFFRDGEALVVPYERRAVVDAVRSVLVGRSFASASAAAASRPRDERRGTTSRTCRRRSIATSLAHGRDEALDRRLVAPVACELARALTGRTAQLGIRGKPLQCRRCRSDILRGNEETVLAVARQIARRADSVREQQRQPRRRRLVDDDTPRLVASRAARRRRRRRTPRQARPRAGHRAASA